MLSQVVLAVTYVYVCMEMIRATAIEELLKLAHILEYMFSPNFLQVFLALACFLSPHSVRFVQQSKIHCVYGVTGCPRLWTIWYLVILATLSLPIFYPFSVANAFCADVLSEYAKGKSVWLLEGNKNTQYERYETKQVAKWENNTDRKTSWSVRTPWKAKNWWNAVVMLLYNHYYATTRRPLSAIPNTRNTWVKSMHLNQDEKSQMLLFFVFGKIIKTTFVSLRFRLLKTFILLQK